MVDISGQEFRKQLNMHADTILFIQDVGVKFCFSSLFLFSVSEWEKNLYWPFIKMYIIKSYLKSF